MSHSLKRMIQVYYKKYLKFYRIELQFYYLITNSNLITVVDDETEDPVSAQIISQDSPFYVVSICLYYSVVN